MTTKIRCIYIGNHGLHNTETHVTEALERAGHTVHRVQEAYGVWVSALPQALATQPDFVLWTHTGRLDHDYASQLRALNDLKDAGIPTVGYHLDLFWGVHRASLIGVDPFFNVRTLITPDADHDDLWSDAGLDHRVLPPATNMADAMLIGRFRQEIAADVAFVGSWHNYHPEWLHRRELVHRMQQRTSFRSWPAAGEVRGQALGDVIASTKIMVGDSCWPDGPGGYHSDRIPVTLGRGGFLLHPWSEQLGDIYEDGVHLRYWPLGDWKELDKLIAYYLAHPQQRQTIAIQGRRHVIDNHTFDNRVPGIIKAAMSVKVP
ncbi:MAG: glycosyltransferase family protein [Actinomycetota bacterium]